MRYLHPVHKCFDIISYYLHTHKKCIQCVKILNVSIFFSLEAVDHQLCGLLRLFCALLFIFPLILNNMGVVTFWYIQRHSGHRFGTLRHKQVICVSLYLWYFFLPIVNGRGKRCHNFNTCPCWIHKIITHTCHLFVMILSPLTYLHIKALIKISKEWNAYF